MNITELLEKDHRKVEQLFEQIEKTKSTARRSELFEKLWGEFSLHATAEEEVVYPAFEMLRETEEKMSHAYEEHQGARQIFAKLGRLNPEDDRWMEMCDELKQEIEHHVKEEEEEIFPRAEEALTDQRLKEIGQQFQEAKRHPRRQRKTA